MLEKLNTNQILGGSFEIMITLYKANQNKIRKLIQNQ